MTVSPAHEKKYSLRTEEQEAGALVLFISGRLALEELNDFTSDVGNMLGNSFPGKLVLNLGGVTYLDSACALALLQWEEYYTSRSIPVAFISASEQIQGILTLLREKTDHLAVSFPQSKKPQALERVGEVTLGFLGDFYQVMSFAGELLIALANSFFRPRSIRWRDVLFYMQKVGADGLPIVGLISLLMGLIMAFMSSLQLRLFGANIYVASLLAIAMVKELGPLMTAILVAGRSGSAFAAEIGTMIVNDEVNALKTMGLEPIRFLAVPKILAAVFVMPLLTIFADLFALLGGLLVGVIGLDLTVFAYIEQTRTSIDVFDILSSMVKSVVFAVLIAGIGCQRGFQVRGGAESVGSMTTSAVVSAIFLIIVSDSAFAIILHYMG